MVLFWTNWNLHWGNEEGLTSHLGLNHLELLLCNLKERNNSCFIDSVHGERQVWEDDRHIKQKIHTVFQYNGFAKIHETALFALLCFNNRIKICCASQHQYQQLNEYQSPNRKSRALAALLSPDILALIFIPTRQQRLEFSLRPSLSVS